MNVTFTILVPYYHIPGTLRQPGLVIAVMCDSVAATVEKVIANGGEIVQPLGVDAPEIAARFRDPGGNVIGLYQELGR